MRGGILIDLSPATGPHGERGIGRYVRGLATAIGAMDRPPTTIGAFGSPGATLDGFRGPRYAYRGLDFRPADTGWLMGWLAARLASARQHPDAIHATDPFRPLTPSRRVLVTLYDLTPMRDPATWDSWRVRHRVVYRAYLRSLRRASVIVAISETAAEDAVCVLGIPRDRIEVVYPVIPAAAGLAAHSRPAPDPDPGEPPEYLWVGALEAHKQPDLAVRALQRLHAHGHPARLRFVGPSAVPRREELEALATRLGVQDAVTFAGRISDHALEQSYARATAVLTTSRFEGFGLPGVEAAIRGAPVIAVRIPASEEALGGAGQLVDADPDAIAEAMAAPRTPSEADRRALAWRHSPEAVARSLATAYARAVGLDA